jgi:hypothetical protein
MRIDCRHLLATLFSAFLAACASPRVAQHDVAPPGAAGYPMDLAQLAKDEDEEERERDRGTPINAEYNLQLEADENGPPSAQQLLRAHEQRKAIVAAATARGQEKAAGLQPSQWQALGPSNVGGRVRSLAFDPRSTTRILAGSASGGLWVSADGGFTWRANQDFLPNLSISAIVFDPVNAATVYMGTGEASAGLVGLGAFKSSDGGNTWQFLQATSVDANPDWRFVNRIAVHPSQPGVLLAGVTNANRVTGGIYRSVDGGQSWTKVATMRALDIAFDPNAPTNALAGLDDGTLGYSRDTGATWTRTVPLIPGPSGRGATSRAEIAFARNQPGLAYASIDNNKGEVWRSSDAGVSWEMLSNPQHLGDQGDYDNAIWIDPTDSLHVVVAGLDIYQSRDGGATFVKVSDWRLGPTSAHADHHALVSPPNFGPANPVLYNANDGGVYRVANVYNAAFSTWTNMNNGLAVTQFYSGAGRTSAGGTIVGGTQDNGSLMLAQGVWRPVRGGDGGFVAVEPTSDQTLFGEYVYLAMHRSLNGGITSSYICSGIGDGLPNDGPSIYCGAGATKSANFIAPFVIDPNNPNRLLAGGASLWVSDSARATTVTWSAIKAPAGSSTNYINAIAVAEGNSNIVWVGYNDGSVYRSLNGATASPTWALMGTLAARQVQRISIDRDDPNRVIVAYTGFVANDVWQTLDGGAHWASITGNLPQAPVFDVKRHPQKPSWLYAATSVGLFTSENGGATWSTSNEGPANIRVRELFWIDDVTLGAATYGRGMWKVSVPALGPANYQALWWAGAAENGWGMSITQHGATLFAAFYIYDGQGQPIWVVMPGGSWNASNTAYTGALYLPSGSWWGSYDASRFSAGASVGTVTITFSDANTATASYTINGVSGTKSITRQPLSAPDSTPVASYADLWWGGPSQNGWGVAINQQYRTLFVVWYTYDASGRTIWYVATGSWTNATTITGTAFRTTGSPWIGAAYNPNALAPTAVGTISINFTDLNNAVMSYTIDGVTGSKPLTRQPF